MNSYCFVTRLSGDCIHFYFSFTLGMIVSCIMFVIYSSSWVLDNLIVDRNGNVVISQESFIFFNYVSNCLSLDCCCCASALYYHTATWGVCGALVESTPFVRRVIGSTPTLAATIGVNPGGLGCHDPQILGWGIAGGSWTSCETLL